MEPIRIAAASAWWEAGHRAVMVRARGVEHVTSCSAVRVSRWLVVTGALAVFVDAEVVEGGEERRWAPRRLMAVEAGRRPDVVIRVPLPDWLAADDVLGVVAEASVPTNAPCANGYSGSYRLYDLVLR